MAVEWGLLGAIILFVCDLGIAATRVSMLQARPSRLRSYHDKRPKAVERVSALLENPHLRPSLRLSQTLTRFFLAGLVFLLVQGQARDSGFLLLIQIGGILLLALIMLVAEFTIESNIMHDPDRWALRLVNFGRVLVIVFYPLVVLPLLVHRPKGAPQSTTQVTEDELKTWIEAEEEPGSLEREERQMIYSIFQLGNTLVREIMLPRIDILALDVNTPIPEAVQVLIRSGHSRVPVYESRVDNIKGLLYAKDLLQIMNLKSKKPDLRGLLRPAYFVPETKKADELLAEMQSRRIHMAVVVDEYGGVAGLVTLEDIVEEIIGEIQDEYDQSEEVLYQSTGQDEYVFQGRIDLDDFNQVIGSHLLKVETDTLAGFIFNQMGRVPQEGETIEVEDLLLTVEQVSGRRIRRVRVKRMPHIEEKKGHDSID